jgi:hypothetical protein
MAGLVPANHVFPYANVVKSWMPGTSPGMTGFSITADSIGRTLSQTLRRSCGVQFIVGIENSAPSLTPEGQRAVTVLVLV